MAEAPVKRVRRFFRGLVWDDPSERRPFVHLAQRAARIIHMVLREIAGGQLTLRAMGLVYTTLLSIVPLLAVSFSVLKGFGVHNQLEPTLLRVFYPLGAKAAEITERIVGFVENVKVGLLGFVGLGLLLYTVISLLHKIESAFNETWRIRQQRGIGKRFTDYLSVLLVGPVLVFTALGLTASLMNSAIAQRVLSYESLAWLVEGLGRFAPVVLVIAAFTFVYVFLPNTRVKLRPALVGAVVAGVLWESIGFGFAAFVASSKSTSAIYSSFAILVIFMIWLYVSWLTLLIGSSVAFYVQHPEYLGLLHKDVRISPRMRERIGLQALVEIGRRHYFARPSLTTAELAERLRMPFDPVQEILERLASSGILVRVEVDGAEGYVPARDLDRIELHDVVSKLRSMYESEFLSYGRIAPDDVLERVILSLDDQREATLGDMTLRDMVQLETVSPITDALPAEERASARALIRGVPRQES
ncbi:MAG: YhjD/YihY/BrkB family envelope integrity protein [Pseudomonadota bacterium]